MRKPLATVLLLSLSACQQAVPTPPAANQRPTVELIAEPDNGAAPLTLTLTAQGSDPDGDPLTYIWAISGAGFETFEGKAVETRTLADPGTYTVEVVVNDGQQDSEADSLEILVRGADEPEL